MIPKVISAAPTKGRWKCNVGGEGKRESEGPLEVTEREKKFGELQSLVRRKRSRAR